MIIGICGGTCSGKSTLANRLKTSTHSERTCVIHLDHYYKGLDQLPLDVRGKPNFDHPESFRLDLLESNVSELVSQGRTNVPIYDFKNHKSTDETRQVLHQGIVVVEGILIAHIPQIRKLIDLVVFLDVPEPVRFQRRLERYTSSGQKTALQITEQFEKTVRPMHELYVEPQKQTADLVLGDDAFEALKISILR